MLIQEIKTSLNSFEIYCLFKTEPYSFFLDSGMDHKGLGKYSFIGANPFLVFKSKDDLIQIEENGIISKFRGNPFAKLKNLLANYQRDYRSYLPFLGGAVGYLAYDLCHHIEALPRTAVNDMGIPDCYFGFYDGVIIIDHVHNKVFAAALGITGTAKEKIDNIITKVAEGEKQGTAISPRRKNAPAVFTANFTKEEYLKAVNKIKEYIKDGDIYQANLTQRFECQLEETPLELYAKLRQINPAPFASFIDFGEGHIVSSSPERFIRITDKIVETRPIKGTRPRGKTFEEDQKNRDELLASEKDKAELLMIVDLERNDLGKICKTGTVKVPQLFHLEKYPTVYHLVSTVVGELRDECDVVDCILASFPGGSITGAPKIRAMEIIDELEPTQRNIYTGSIGYIGFNGDADLNIAIRTIVCKDQKAYFQTGGGIVWDSDAEEEYQETLHKAKALMKALNS
ncbi:MAG: para-aminobenzoate synthetase component [Clostridia bacterium]|jgi:para-aminobenzoate synthetase component 1|nr:para-aminobenzoate synthetase component [Clostridia bacterium]MDN5322027.1 para-aminobenzoate synthetase component [Clostridia bacterium]